ncbi:MAG: hypothetical protein GX053_12600 [Tissierella sp.]|nr:hypothetical protein [Tissierella sp.]
MLEMFKGVANSPETTITNNISNSDTLIYVLDETRIPEPPNLMVLGTGVGAETIKVLSIDGNAITVERGFQGVAKAWNAGTIIARNFTEYDYNALVENVKTLKDNTDTNAGDILDLMRYVGDLESLDTTEKSNIVLALNEIYQDLASHKAENVNTKEVHGMRMEIGTWTPELQSSGGGESAVYGARYGHYIRIGKFVLINMRMDISSFTGGSGVFRIAGLPFASVHTLDRYNIISMMGNIVSNISGVATINGVFALPRNNEGYGITVQNLTTTKQLSMSGVYQIP